MEGGDDARLAWCWATPIRTVSGGLFLYCCFLPKCMCAHICTMRVVGTQVEVREQLCRTDSLHRVLCGFQESNFCRQPCIARTPSLATQSSFWPLCWPFDAKDDWGKCSPPLWVPELKPPLFCPTPLGLLATRHVKLWDPRHLNRAKKVTFLPSGLTISDPSTYFQTKSLKGKHSWTANSFNNLWSGNFYLGLAKITQVLFSHIASTLND